jgi:hypothetical protein
MRLSDQALEEYEKSLGLPAGFIKGLEDEGDDWSFTIKAHALIETGLTELIIHCIGKPALDEMLARLPITGQFSKLAIIRALKPIADDGETEAFTGVLGGIRNRLVHNIKRIDFSLNNHFQELHAKDASEFQRQRNALDLLYGDMDSFTLDDEKVDAALLFRESARLLIATSLGMILVRIHVSTGFAKWTKGMQETATRVFSQSIIDELLKQHGSKGSDVESK